MLQNVENFIMFITYNVRNKFALLWGEAQLCLTYVCLKKVDNLPIVIL